MAGKKIFITGVTRGIGLAIAQQRAMAGDTIIGIAKTWADFYALEQDLLARGAPNVYLHNIDICDQALLYGWLKEQLVKITQIDIVCHCAAILGPRTPLLQVRSDDWQRVLTVNLTGTFNTLINTGLLANPLHKTLWLWFSSSVGLHGRAHWGPYAATKAALENLNQTFAEEIQDKPWTTVTVNPGATATDMRKAAYPEEDPTTLASTTNVAQKVDLLIAKWQKKQLISGQHIDLRTFVS